MALSALLGAALFVSLFLNGNLKGTKPEDNFKIVDTKFGKVQGKIIQVTKDDGQEEKVYRFRNIPYAEPPVGDLRWKPPKRAKIWDDILEYSDQKIKCTQTDENWSTVGTEDCLILTIRQPASANATNPYPVLFWMHGGALIYGSSDWYYPDEQCSASLEMVTVSINYRLNMFGFLSIKEIWSIIGEPKDQFYGNFGIMDIVLALEWVKENIESFGGDPNRVTILGQSGGGAAVYSLLKSPMTNSLFSKAIASSGYPLSLKSNFRRANSRYGDSFKHDLNCSKGLDEEIAICLHNKTVDEINVNLYFPVFFF